jgi:salicylate 5-hydroxylase large subunit
MTEQPIHWETDGTSRIPFAVYTDEDRHKKELERFFYKSHWSINCIRDYGYSSCYIIVL